MKMFAIGAGLVLCLGLTACAGTASNSRLAHHQSMYDDVDYSKIITVNQWALKRGATVVWINYPTTSARTKPTDG